MKTKQIRTKLLVTIGLSVVVAIGVFLLIMSNVNASGIYYCENCGARLSTSGQRVNDWYYFHTFEDEVNGKQSCRVDCYVERIYYYCPNGHGKKDVVDNPVRVHNHPMCPERNK